MGRDPAGLTEGAGVWCDKRWGNGIEWFGWIAREGWHGERKTGEAV